MRLSDAALSRLELAQEAAHATNDFKFASDLRALLDAYYKLTQTERQPVANEEDMEE